MVDRNDSQNNSQNQQPKTSIVMAHTKLKEWQSGTCKFDEMMDTMMDWCYGVLGDERKGEDEMTA